MSNPGEFRRAASRTEPPECASCQHTMARTYGLQTEQVLTSWPVASATPSAPAVSSKGPSHSPATAPAPRSCRPRRPGRTCSSLDGPWRTSELGCRRPSDAHPRRVSSSSTIERIA